MSSSPPLHSPSLSNCDGEPGQLPSAHAGRREIEDDGQPPLRKRSRTEASPVTNDHLSDTERATPAQDLQHPPRYVNLPVAEHINTRLERLCNYTCSSGAWFSLSMVPSHTDWTVLYGNHRINTLSYLDRPLNIWITAKLQSLNVYLGPIPDSPTVRITLELLRDADRIAAANIERLVHRSHVTATDPILRAVAPGGYRGQQVSASTENCPQGASDAAPAQILNEVYDATHRYTAKSAMPKLSVTALRPGDVILAECWFVRKQILGGWTTFFQIRSLAQLLASPAVPQPDVAHPAPHLPFPWDV
ncbi:hypothetical protein OH77DRAFT_1436777 [Trametes cingulata]|nr:hypothetical protein OH77DRAFT_1436777 [Trametes cingulata]